MKSKLVALLAAVCLSSTALASTINISSTGVNASGAVLPDGTLGDLHYQLVGVPGGTTTIGVLSSASGYPIGPWIGDDTLSRWIGPYTGDANGPAGWYTYRTQFTLSAAQLTGASLTGRFAADDNAFIRLNGTHTGITSGGFGSYTNYAISSSFIVGLNTLDFMVNNGGGPTGLRVQADAAVPEPASLALLGLGLLALGAMRRKARQG